MEYEKRQLLGVFLFPPKSGLSRGREEKFRLFFLLSSHSPSLLLPNSVSFWLRSLKMCIIKRRRSRPEEELENHLMSVFFREAEICHNDRLFHPHTYSSVPPQENSHFFPCTIVAKSPSFSSFYGNLGDVTCSGKIYKG